MKNLIPYFTLGYPNNSRLCRFLDILPVEKINYIEFGFPSNDPRYDGPVIRNTHIVGNSNFSDSVYSRYFDYFYRNHIKMYSLSYYSDIKDRFHEFIAYLQKNRFSGIIIPDLIIDYFSEFRRVIEDLNKRGFEYIPFFSPATPDSIIKDVASLTDSWIYYGLQPSTGIEIPYELDYTTERINALLPGREITYGFGIKTDEDIKNLMKNGGSGVAIGTYLVKMIDSGDEKGFVDYINRMRGVLDA
ncbi:tryptophan synthase subunit alpha [Ferroplasma sp.]|uniref:tryptophan synthase subunit alpha n=1 Tax=Ferroplasma sp. TaxID=2591003 RepID=UPI00262BE69D|nr:tryptophan synthase subunit alpha [Ferroplasma sp.]MCL4452530.1 tryptophan synthase subunit alpha [Candidatus Thermoplasmatota archaeon]